MNRILVDMSATLLHHGHIRLLKRAKEFGYVIVALTTDNEIKLKKGYKPELSYKYRKEILESIVYVDEVIPSRWLIDNKFMLDNKIDYLMHGNDNSNNINPKKLLIFPRTVGISSSLLRKKSHMIYVS
jgi:glycerol-3-phosphate cytidylyltransferase